MRKDSCMKKMSARITGMFLFGSFAALQAKASNIPLSSRLFLGLLLCMATLSAALPKDTINMLVSYEKSQGFELMFDSTFASYQKYWVDYKMNDSANTTLNNNWTVDSTITDSDRPGVFFRAIKNLSAGGEIRSFRQYKNFDWRFEYRCSGNEGFYYRENVKNVAGYESAIEFAVDDNLSDKSGAGAAYGLFAPNPFTYQKYSTGKWNSVRIVAVADSVEHWMNGKKIVSFRYWSPAFIAAYNDSKWNGWPAFCQTAPNNHIYISRGFFGMQADHGGQQFLRRMRVLNDSLPSQNRVKLGPINENSVHTVHESFSSTGSVKGFKIERLPQGLRVSMTFGTLRSVQILNLDGRAIQQAHSLAGSDHVIINTTKRCKGLCVLRMETSAGIFAQKIMIE